MIQVGLFRKISLPRQPEAPSWITKAAVAVVIACLGASQAIASQFQSPEILNSHVIFAPACSKIVYSSNRSGPVRPYVVDMTNPAHPQVTEVALDGSDDYIAQSLAPDCRTLAMVSDPGGSDQFQVYLYDLTDRTSKKISAADGHDDGAPAFASSGKLLAYLSDGKLSLYDYGAATHLASPPGRTVFKSLSWSRDAASLFLEDDSSNIWQYDPSSQLLREIWTAPQRSYTRRMLSARAGHLLFVSDHETDFEQIYALDLRTNSLKRLFATDRDQFSPVDLGAGYYTFRTDIDENFVAAELQNGKYAELSPRTGVTYDFSLDFGPPLLFFSNDQLPLSLYWSENGKLKPLVPVEVDPRQPAAIPVKSASGMTNFLYLPSNSPRGWLVWLHGGPHEQISPRYNPFFDFLARLNIAVYAINYPGSTGIGKKYALQGLDEKGMIQTQVRSIDEDIDQLRRLYPGISSLMLLGVSYGSIPAHMLLRAHPELFSRFVDFSGIADTSMVPDAGVDPKARPPMLFIYGDNDEFFKSPERKALITQYESIAPTSRLVLPGEGHYIQQRASNDRILAAIGVFLAEAPGPVAGDKHIDTKRH